MMPDYHNPDDPFYHDFDDPLPRNVPTTRAANAAWVWISAAVLVLLVLAVAFGIGHRSQVGTNTASNDVTPPPAINHMSRPAIAPALPISPAPDASAH